MWPGTINAPGTRFLFSFSLYQPPLPYRLRGGQAVLFIPLSRIETEKMDMVGGAAANHIHFFGIFPFSLEGEGTGG
jgi:hypothetical protein